MQPVLDFLSKIPAFPIPQLIGLIALGCIGLAVFAIYVVYAAVVRRK